MRSTRLKQNGLPEAWETWGLSQQATYAARQVRVWAALLAGIVDKLGKKPIKAKG